MRATVLTAALVFSACSSQGGTDDPVADAADIDRLVIGDLVERSGVRFDTSVDELPVLYVEAFGAEEIPLEVQVDVVAGWQETYDVRFIDDRSEAVQDELEGRPVRERSLLLGLGPITRNGTAELRGEYYRSEDQVGAYRYTLVETGGGWRLSTGPEQIDPEGFAATP